MTSLYKKTSKNTTASTLHFRNMTLHTYKFLFIGLYELFYHAAATDTKTVPAELSAGTEIVLRTPAYFYVGYFFTCFS